MTMQSAKQNANYKTFTPTGTQT